MQILRIKIEPGINFNHMLSMQMIQTRIEIRLYIWPWLLHHAIVNNTMQ
jgi:hypothetical protein